MITHQGALGWKMLVMGWVDRLLLQVPFWSEFWNQGVSKSMGLLQCWHFLSRTGIEGDYLEFGVFRGETFRNMLIASRNIYRSTVEKKFNGRFFAFDSFEGLPDVSSSKNKDNIFKKGDFSASRKTFNQTVRGAIQDSTVIVEEGWFSHTLTSEFAQKHQIRKIAFANVDCDLYESTQDCLRFITPFLQTGTVLYFDDWFSCKGSMNEGEPLACREWLAVNTNIDLIEYKNIGVLGKAFIVNIKGA